MAKKSVMTLKGKRESNAVKSEKGIISRFAGIVESPETVKNPDLMDFQALRGLLFLLINCSESFYNFHFPYIIKSCSYLKFCNIEQVKDLVLKNKSVEALNKFRDTLDKRLLDINLHTFSLYRKVLSLAFQFFGFKDLLRSDNNYYDASIVKVCERLLEFCFYMSLENYIAMQLNELPEDIRNEIYKVTNAENQLKGIIKYAKCSDTYPLNADVLQNTSCSDSMKSDLIMLYDTVFKYWYSTDSDSISLRNSFDLVKDLPFSNDMTLFLNMLRKDFYAEAQIKIVGNRISYYFDDCDKKIPFFEDEKSEEEFSAFFRIIARKFIAYTNNFVSYLFVEMTNKYMKEKVDGIEESKLDLSNQLKELKSLNRNLTKNVKKLDDEVSSLKSEIESNKEKISAVTQVESENQELIELRKRVQELEDANKSLVEEQKKVSNRNEWLENKVEGLEFNLKYYQDIENDLLVLQNDNNALNGQIERIEKLEEDDSEFNDYDKKLSQIKDEPILFLGGHPNITGKLISLFPNSEVFDLSEGTSNFDIPGRIKYVAVFTRMVKHCYCERAESIMGKENIIPLNIFNSRLIVDELYKHIVGHKN